MKLKQHAQKGIDKMQDIFDTMKQSAINFDQGGLRRALFELDRYGEYDDADSIEFDESPTLPVYELPTAE